jgi:WD40 repeat protein/tetratricopeptide (TPR) repeat protein
MSDPTNHNDPRQQQLEEVIGAFLVALDRGENPDPQDWLARHPDLLPELAEFFANRERLVDLIDPLMAPAAECSEAPALSITSTQGGSADSLARATSDGSGLASDEPGNGALSDSLSKGARVRYFGDYELQKVLGEGGMGIVYKARQISLNRPVAVKMIKATRFVLEDDLRRFHNEAEAVAQLDHPNIVPIYEVGQFEDQHYFSMKLIGGGSLDKRLKDYMAQPRRAAELLEVAARAVHHAHQRGILHRDLKPANILLDAEGRPHITDFGLAKRVEGDSELTHSGAILGSPPYMAPEQASGTRGAVTISTDVYGLGAIFYAMMTGKAPFSGLSVLDTLDQVRERPPEPPTKHNPRVPKDLEVLCMKCLEKEPWLRYANAEAFAEELKRWLNGEPILARPVGKATRFWMWCRRNPVVAGAAGLAFAALAAVAILSLLYARQQTRLAEAAGLVVVEQTRRADEQTEATRTITGLAENLKEERGNLKTSLADTNRRLAMYSFEKAQRAFDSGQVNHGMLGLVDTWRYAAMAGDQAWEHLARANLSLWRYSCPQVRAIFTDSSDRHAEFLAGGRTILTVGAVSARLWDIATGRPIGDPLTNGSYIFSWASSPDGKTVVTAGQDNTARLWNTSTGRPIGEPLAHRATVKALEFSPDSKTVHTVSEDGTARIWDVKTGRPIGGPIAQEGIFPFVRFSPDGKRILTGAGRTLRLWHAESGLPISRSLEHSGIGSGESAAFSPDSKTLAAADRDKVRLWDSSTGLPVGRPMVHQVAVNSVAFSADGKKILTGSFDNSARLWDAASCLPIGPPLKREGQAGSGQLTVVSFSPDGKTFLVRGSQDNIVRLGNSATGLQIGKPMEHDGRVIAAAFSPDGTRIVTASRNLVRLWDAATVQPIGHPLVHQGAVASVAFSPDGTSVLAVANGSAWLYEIPIGLPLGKPLDDWDSIRPVAYSPDGRSVLTQTSGPDPCWVRLWEVSSGLPVGQPMEHHGAFVSSGFTADGRTVLTLTYDRTGVPTVRRWDSTMTRSIGRPLTLGAPAIAKPVVPRSESEVVLRGGSPILSPSGKSVLIIDGDAKATLWDAATGQRIVIQSGVDAAAYSPDGRVLIIGGGTRTAQLWDSSTGQSIGPLMPHQAPVTCVAFSPDGKIVVTGSANGFARIWSARSAQPIGRSMEHRRAVRSVVFSTDGQRILTLADGVVRLWNAADQVPLAKPFRLPGDAFSTAAVPTYVKWEAISPDGTIILVSGRPSEARLLDSATGQPIGPALQHEGVVGSSKFGPDGKSFVTASSTYRSGIGRIGSHSVVRLWHLPALIPDDFALIKLWVETLTGLETDDEGNVSALNTDAWLERREQLVKLGGVPESSSGWLLDPVLYGANPTARARAWIERERWTEAEAALTEAVRSRPLSGSVWIERSRFYLRRSEPDKAAADVARALGLLGRDQMPLMITSYTARVLGLSRQDQLILQETAANDAIFDHVIARLHDGVPELTIKLLLARADHLARRGQLDRARAIMNRVANMPWEEALPSSWSRFPEKAFAALGFHGQVSAILGKYRGTTDPFRANNIAWYCALSPGGPADREAALRLAKLALERFPTEQKHHALNSLGAALYRAGRFEEAVLRLEEGIRLRKKEERTDWPFLAMAHNRLGHHDEARHWLEKLRKSEPNADPGQFWEEMEIRLLRSEAEAVILYDPIFPADPFAH